MWGKGGSFDFVFFALGLCVEFVDAEGFWFVLWVLARLFCFACDTGFGEVDFAGGLRNGLKVWGGIGCEVWGMPMLAARWCLRCSQLATSSQKHVRHSMYSILHTCVQPCERIYVCVCCLPERSARGECSCVFTSKK